MYNDGSPKPEAARRIPVAGSSFKFHTFVIEENIEDDQI